MPGTFQRQRKSSSEVGTDPALAAFLPAWVVRSLENGGIRRLPQLAGWKDAELMQLRGIGPRSVELIRAALRHTRKTTKSKAPRQ